MNIWRDLDPSVRKALLEGRPVGDLETDRIGRAYAEQRLGRSQPRNFLVGILIGLGVGLPLGLLVVLDVLSMAATGLVVIAMWLGYLVYEVRRKAALIRLLNVSNGAPRVPVMPVMPGPPGRLEIRVRTRGVLRMMAPFLGLVAIPVAVGLAYSVPVPAIAALAVVPAVLVIAYLGHLLSWSIPGRPTILDADGLHSPKDGVRIGWEAVREIRIVLLRATAGDRRHVLAFLLHDDQIYLRQLSSWQVLLGKINKKTYLSPLVLMDGMYDRSMVEIAASAAALSGIPYPRHRGNSSSCANARRDSTRSAPRSLLKRSSLSEHSTPPNGWR
ncbi:hypothetical protein [Nocardia sp. CA-290969]|uniref:hypothetical protein n=1 Tax=Nocardia sp. CA-290969 TaxID=3239986 RepID=UPI003D89D87F